MKSLLVCLALVSPILGGIIKPADSGCACPSDDIIVAGGTIKSPNFPGEYCANLRCVYRLQAIQNHLVKLTVVSFSSELSKDILTIYDGPKYTDDEVIIAQLSGLEVIGGTVLYSGKQQMTLTFNTDDINGAGGFELNFVSVVDNGCGKVDGNGTFQTPNYPYNYPDDLKCVWTYEAPTGLNGRVSFGNDSVTELGGDFVVIAENGKRLATYSGPGPFKTISGVSQNLSVTFTSDNSVIHSGFRGSFTNFAPPRDCSCGQGTRRLPGPDKIGTLDSPNYDGFANTYCPRLTCTWFLEVPENHYAHVEFVDIDLGSDNYNIVTIDNGLEGVQIESCQGKICQPRTSSNQYITVTLKINSEQPSKGFSLQFKAVEQ